MNISELVEARQRRVERIRDSISASEAVLASEEEALAKLIDLSSKSTYSIEEINYLIDRSNDL